MAGSGGGDHLAMCIGKPVRQSDQTAAQLVRLGGDDCFNLGVVVNRSERRGHSE